jgi:hypothetical protein
MPIATLRNPGYGDATSASPQLINLQTGGTISTLFVFKSVDSQNAANSVYSYTSTFNSQQVAAGKSTTYNFKTDYERMQYLQGQFAVAPRTSGY